MNLEAFGWNEFFARSFAAYAAEGYGVGRVFLQHNKIYLLYTVSGEIFAEVTGKLAHQAQGREDFPAVGDWVVISDAPRDGKAAIHAVLPRQSKFSRKAAGSRTEEQIVAANVDTIFLVTGLDNDFNVRRIERYLIMTHESGSRAVIVLNKADVAPEDAALRAREVGEVAPGVPVVLMSAKQGAGVEQLLPFIGEGQTVALMGSSGVGKSTIVNRLLGENAQRTQEVRSGDDRGKHTTTHRELIFLPTGGLIMDTPGMRELQLLVSDRGLRETFEDIETLAAQCRFGDCRHSDEPDCAIKRALGDGTLSAERYESYQKMQGEMKQAAIKQNQRAAQVEKGRVKKITRAFNKTKNRH